MTPMASVIPLLIIRLPFNCPFSSEGTKKAWVTTVTTMISMLIRANVEALASLAMSRYILNGNEMPRTNIMMIARRSVRSQRSSVSSSDGKMARKTVGIVSPIIMQKASMPPKALYQTIELVHRSQGYFVEEGSWEGRTTYKAHCAIEIATNPACPKQC